MGNTTLVLGNTAFEMSNTTFELGSTISVLGNTTFELDMMILEGFVEVSSEIE